MNKILLSMLSLLLFCAGNLKAQTITADEPEFAEQVLLLTDAASGKLLPKENASIKTKAAASMYLVGIGKVKERLTVEGKESSVSTKPGKVQLIIRAKDNETDPNSFINICKFEVKGKRRQFQVGEIGTFTGAKSNATSSVDYTAKKYGKSSYLVTIENAEPGEYGVTIGNPNSETEKNYLKISTFGVK